LPKFLGGCGDNDAPGGINTLVVLCMENRSYDHYLGPRALQGLGGDGLLAGMSNLRSDGSVESIFHEGVSCIPDPPHSWAQSRAQFNSGANDGFMREYQRLWGSTTPPHVMGYFERDDLPFSWALADAYATSDRWFSSLMGPTWPNRMYLHSGQSGGLIENILPTNGGINWPSIHHQLNAAGVDWAYYYQDLPFVPLFQELDIGGHVRRVNNDFFKDAKAGTLPPVVWIDPNFDLNDDHPPHHQMLGQQFMASVYAALAASPQWENCMLVITYDEHGGYFDHVPPPKAADERASLGFDQLGFRVPAFVAGPYVKQGHVSSVVRDHCTVLSHITKQYDLDPLTERVAWSPDLSDFIDLERLAAGKPAPPVAMPEVVVNESELVGACAQFAPSQPELSALADAGFFPQHMDLRHRRLEDGYAIGAAAEALGAGRIRYGH
jgi:phospholipase C